MASFDPIPEELLIVTAEQFDRAFGEYARWGPEDLIPIETRWPAVIPDVDRSKYPELGEKCREVQWTPVAWAETLRTKLTPDDCSEELNRMVAAKYPFLTLERRRAIVRFAMFAADR
jgi:hypothetical protein